MKRTTAFIGFFILIILASHGQSTNVSGLFQNNFKKAERIYLQQGYRHAINLYRLALDRDPGNRLAKARVADCYYRMGQFEESGRWYRELVGAGKPMASEYFRLGMVMSALEKYDSAFNCFEQALALDSADPRSRRKMDFIQAMDQYRRDPGTYAMRREWYNSPHADFSPRHFGQGIVFVSSRDRESFIKRTPWDGMSDDEGLLNAFYVDGRFDSMRLPEEQVNLFYSRSLNSPYHDGPVTFYHNGTRIAYTRNLIENGKPAKDEIGRVNLELYFATLGDKRTLKDLEAYPYNNRSYSIAHPWISEDGKTLYFSSNMPGGKGGADLYVSYHDGKSWSPPQNLSELNTASDEFSPYFWNDQLFFSSDGIGGFGGLDNYVARKTKNGFSEPENLGFPLNSSLDDFGLIIDGEGREGYFASNRVDRNDDIYKFRLNKVTLFGHVRDLKSGEPIAKASVGIMRSDGTDPLSVSTDARGNFRVELEVDQEYKVKPSKDGYTSLSDQMLKLGQASIISDTLDVTLWKNALYAMGVVYSNELQKKLPGATVYINNVTLGTVDSVRTGDQATYNFLVLPNSMYKVFARYPGYLENGFTLNTKGLIEGNLLNDVLLEEVFLEKMIVRFGYDKWDLWPEFENDLRRITRSLGRNRGSTVYVGAHADAQGTREYNKNLSDKRADTIVAYLTSKGIARDRIEAYGFGEELILNTCSDGVECTDEQHSKNRRAEIKVQLAGDR